MLIEILTLFPDMFAPLKQSVLGKAQDKEVFSLNITNIRDYSTDKHNKCDDTPFGGGAGMVMTPQPLYDAITARDPEHKCLRIYMSPRGKVLSQKLVEELANKEALMFVCGHYEGIDQRIIDNYVDMELSIGDYVLTGGELPAMVVADSVLRYVDGVICHDSTDEESFTNGLLEYPHYTRPSEFMGYAVPPVLRSGNHAAIAKWRHAQQLTITESARPDVFRDYITNHYKPTKRRR